MIRRALLLLLSCGFLPVVCCSQDSQAAPPSLASQQPTQSTTEQTPTPAAKTGKPKKVWTNDDVGNIQGTVSVVGSNPPAERQTQSSQDVSGSAADPRRGKILRYRAAIAELRKKIDAADQRITQLKNFKADNSSPTGGINPNRSYNMIPLDEQVKQLEAKKKQLEANIEDTENQAKKEGIEPGELR